MSLVETSGLSKRYPVREGIFHRTVGYEEAVKNVNLSLEQGEILGLVGESGCGKTTLARLILRLLKPSTGEIRFDGDRIDHLSQRAFRRYRRDIQVIFQDPMESFDPRYRIGTSIQEGMNFLTDWSREERKDRAVQALEEVDMGASYLSRYPHQLSGGQRQRIGIARALTLRPKLLICDEPSSALDVSIQAQIVNLLLRIKEEHGLSYLFISHDLNLVRFVSDRITVMKDGEIVELGPANRVYDSPSHPYTRRLLESLPSR